jgi:hypothetical protein
LGPDPEWNIDSRNLYSFVGGRPTVASDPTGRYSKDFHFYAVYYLARAAGFPVLQSRYIAWASQYVDDNSATTAVSVQDFVFRHERFTKTLRAFHFVSPNMGLDPVAPGNPIAAANLDRAIGTGSLMALGIALHSWADTFAHSTFVGVWNAAINTRVGRKGTAKIGHLDAPEGGNYPDKPYHEIDKAVAAAQSIHEVLLLSARQHGFGGGRPWPAVRDIVRFVFSQSEGRPKDAKELESLRDVETPARCGLWRTLIAEDYEDVSYELLPVSEGWTSAFGHYAETQRRFVLRLEGISEP